MSVIKFLENFEEVTVAADYTDSVSDGEWSCIRGLYQDAVLVEFEPIDENSILLGLVKSFQKDRGLGLSAAFKAVSMVQQLADTHNVTLLADISPTDGQITPERLERLAHRANFITTNISEIDSVKSYHVIYEPKSL